jgi:hypothetical protein
MNIVRISFQQTFPTGNFSNNKLGVEIELGENEDPINGFEQAKKIVNEAFEKLNPQINWNESEGTKEDPFNRRVTITDIPKIINKEKERIEIAIDNCQSKPELLLLQSDALKYDLIKQYINKLNSFTV